MNNPICAELEKQESIKLEKAKGCLLPIHICCVIDEYTDYNDPIIHSIRNHCVKNNVLFTARIYDSYKYNCDRDYIERLPAVHIFMKQLYQKTYYLNGRPLQNVDDIIKVYMKNIEAKEARKQIWKKRISIILKWIRSLTHRKTRMERYNESIEWVEPQVIELPKIRRGFTGGGPGVDFLPPSYS